MSPDAASPPLSLRIKVLIATGILALLGYLGWVQLIRDEPEMIPAGFVLPARLSEVTEAENGLVFLANEMDKHEWPAYQKAHAEIIAWRQPWNAELMQPLVEAGPAVRSLSEGALQFAQWDVERGPGSVSLYKPFLLSQDLLRARIRQLSEAGEAAEAMEWLTMAQSVVLRYQMRSSSLAAFMIGAGSRAVLDGALLQILAKSGTPDAVFERGMKFMEVRFVAPEAFIAALVMDHFRELDTSFDLRKDPTGFFEKWTETRNGGKQLKWLLDSRFKPQAYHNLKLRHLALLNQLAFAEGTAARAKIQQAREQLASESTLSLLSFDPNRAGRIFAAVYSNYNIEEGLFCKEATRRCCLAVIAAKRWSLAHGGERPVSLTELVPEYLKAVPLDPWDGQPLRWDAANGTAYTIGSDGVEDLPVLSSNGRLSVSDKAGSAAQLP